MSHSEIRPQLTTETKTKFPYVNPYISSLEQKKMTEEGINNEINLLNKVSLCDEPMSTSQRLGVAALASFNPLTIFGGVLGYYWSGDQCDPECRKSQHRYEDFVAKSKL